MNKSFENLFEKYNISYSIPKKVQKKSRNCKPKYEFQRNRSTSVNFQEISSNMNSSFYFNSSTKGKYNIATRYKTLEVIERENVSTGCCSSSDIFNNSTAASSPKVNGSKSEISKNDFIFNKNNACSITSSAISSDFKNIQDKRKYFSSSLNIGRRKLSLKNRSQTQFLRYNQLDVTISKPKRNNSSINNITTLNETDNLLNDSFNPPISSSPEPSHIIETPTTTQESGDNGNSELNLLIDLIQREDRNLKKQSQKIKDKKTHPKGGGYEELFERALKCEMVRGNFLKHDRKLGLRTGKLLTVVDIDRAYGLTIAVVKSDDLLKNVGVVIAQEMLAQLKLGGQIETYFDDKSLPYRLPYKGDYLDIYLEPYKLLIV